MSSPLVSVVVPTYNRRALIGATIEGILKQTYVNLELIIVDDGSTDGTMEFVQDTFGCDPRLWYVHQHNSERAVARNTGIQHSRGQYVAFVDSDDLWAPTKLERQMIALSQTDELRCCYCLHDCLGSSCDDRDAAALSPEGDIFEPLLSGCFIGSMTPLVPRKCFDVVGSFCEDRRMLCFEDWEMWTRLASRFRWELVPEVLGRHRLHDENSQRAADSTVDELRIQSALTYSLTQRHRASLRRYIAGRRWHWAAALRRTDPRQARTLLTRLALHDPRQLMLKSYWGLLASTWISRHAANSASSHR